MIIRKFLHDRRGNFAVMAALSIVTLLISMGGYVDYSRQSSAYDHLQTLADSASLNLAGSRLTDDAKLRALAKQMIRANEDPNTIKDVTIVSLKQIDQKIELQLSGRIDTTLMRFANVMTVGVQAASTAERGINGQVEVALVLDNTFSMSEPDGNGGTKMTVLKSAAADLVKKVLADKNGQVRVSVVPYADYVNVGTSNRSAKWLDVKDDYVVMGPPKKCETRTTKSVCTAWSPTYSCPQTIDGVVVPATCGGGCAKWEPRQVAPYQYCTGGGSTAYKWYGCVGSRMPAKARLDDGSPNVRYPGYLATSQLCPTPITKLTSDQSTVLSAISAMVTNKGSYYPLTYIPAGLIWGQNVLSGTAPFTEGKDYDPANIAPRKVVVLMTDGDNTLRFQQSDGKHVAFQSGNEIAQRNDTDEDTAKICDYMKLNKIEVFSVAFMVDNTQAKNLLEACATDASHYYDASDSQKLIDSFQAIADSLAMVRLVK